MQFFCKKFGTRVLMCVLFYDFEAEFGSDLYFDKCFKSVELDVLLLSNDYVSFIVDY